jgi:cardiolipin synthase A/B
VANSPRSSLELLRGASEYFPALVQAIDEAESSIYIESYLIHDDPPTQEVLQALIRARSRMVEVYLMLDGFGSQEQIAWVKEQLLPHGVVLEVYRPGVKWLAPRTWRRLHRKLALIDERIGFVGGVNLIGDRYDIAHGMLAQPRLDFAVRVTSLRVVDAISRVMRRLYWRVSLRAIFRGDLRRFLQADQRHQELYKVRNAWRRSRRHLRKRRSYAGLNVSRRARLLLRNNIRFRRGIERWYLWRIEEAKHEVLIANAYFVPTLRFRQALIAAASRGVHVRLLIQGNSDQWWTHWATQALIEELDEAGIEIYQYMPSFLHAKVAVIDEAVTVGSSNIDPFSLMMSLEANVMAQDALLANQLRQEIESAIRLSSRRTPHKLARRSPIRAIARRVALTVSLMALRAFVAFSRTNFQVR